MPQELVKLYFCTHHICIFNRPHITRVWQQHFLHHRDNFWKIKEWSSKDVDIKKGTDIRKKVDTRSHRCFNMEGPICLQLASKTMPEFSPTWTIFPQAWNLRNHPLFPQMASQRSDFRCMWPRKNYTIFIKCDLSTVHCSSGASYLNAVQLSSCGFIW